MYITHTADANATDAMHLFWSFDCEWTHYDKRVILLIGNVKIASRQALPQVQYAAHLSNLRNISRHLIALTWTMQHLATIHTAEHGTMQPHTTTHFKYLSASCSCAVLCIAGIT